MCGRGVVFVCVSIFHSVLMGMCIRIFQVEWGASEDVVQEQVSTEEALASYATELQGDVTKRQEDIINLFAKVDRHVSKEQSRIQSITSFVTDTDTAHVQLQDSVRDMLTKSDEHSSQLCEGVADMLLRGKDLCGVLKESIAGALTVLVGDTAVAKDKMTASCDGLQTHLDETRTGVVASLHTLQESLSAWLGEVEQSMATTRDVLAKQKQYMEELDRDVDTMSVHYERSSQKFLVNQQMHSAATLSDLSTLKDDISATVNELKETSASQLKKREELIQQNTEHIQRVCRGVSEGDCANTPIHYLHFSSHHTHSEEHQSTQLMITGLTSAHKSLVNIAAKVFHSTRLME